MDSLHTRTLSGFSTADPPRLGSSLRNMLPIIENCAFYTIPNMMYGYRSSPYRAAIPKQEVYSGKQLYFLKSYKKLFRRTPTEMAAKNNNKNLLTPSPNRKFGFQFSHTENKLITLPFLHLRLMEECGRSKTLCTFISSNTVDAHITQHHTDTLMETQRVFDV